MSSTFHVGSLKFGSGEACQARRTSRQVDDMTAGSTNETSALAQAARQRWLGVLVRAPRDELVRQVEAVPLPAFIWLRRPEVGMVMLRGRAGGTGQPFNLGEATVTRCALRAGDYVGSGHVLGRDARHAELQDPAQQARLLAQVVEPLAQAQQVRRDSASRAAAATRVEFFTLVRGT
jgi:alpha-D-ribose 1-methylphosphonate 5-triphosphate synthase subunit PhnG